jgi:antitoxin CptB
MPGTEHQSDPARRRRLRWRARRGLLENDLVLTRFFEQHEEDLDDEAITGLDQLLDLPDNELLELVLRRRELSGEQATPQAMRVLKWLRDA